MTIALDGLLSQYSSAITMSKPQVSHFDGPSRIATRSLGVFQADTGTIHTRNDCVRRGLFILGMLLCYSLRFLSRSKPGAVELTKLAIQRGKNGTAYRQMVASSP
jgi:hypothetical protein